MIHITNRLSSDLNLIYSGSSYSILAIKIEIHKLKETIKRHETNTLIVINEANSNLKLVFNRPTKYFKRLWNKLINIIDNDSNCEKYMSLPLI